MGAGFWRTKLIEFEQETGYFSQPVARRRDIRRLNDVIYLRVPADEVKEVKVTARIFAMKDSDNSGRFVTLEAKQVSLH